MAKGIQLAGGYGAGGVKDALVEIIAQRLAQQQFEEQKAARVAGDDHARAQLTQRVAEANQRAEMDQAQLRQGDRHFGETLGLNVKKFDEDKRTKDRDYGRGVVEFDTTHGFREGEAKRDQGNKDRSFGLDDLQLKETGRHNRAMEGVAGQRASGGANAKSTEQLDALADMVLKDPELLKNLPPTDRSRVLAHIGTSKEGGLPNRRAESTRAMLEATAETIKQLKTMKGRGGAVGAPSIMDPGSLTRLLGRDPMAGSDAANYTATIDKLRSQLTLPRMEMLRGLGAMSDREFKTLSDSATSLGSSLSEDRFGTELDAADAAVASMLSRLGAGGAPSAGGDDAGPASAWDLYQRRLKGGQ